MKQIIRIVKSETFIFIPLIFILTVQVLHSTYLFHLVSVFDLSFTYQGVTYGFINWLSAAIFAIAIESAILMFVLNGKIWPSKIYALATLITNILYYEPWYLDVSKIPASILISCLLACSIWFFSDLFADRIVGTDRPLSGKSEDELQGLSLVSESGDDNGEQARKFKTTMPENRINNGYKQV